MSWRIKTEDEIAELYKNYPLTPQLREWHIVLSTNREVLIPHYCFGKVIICSYLPDIGMNVQVKHEPGTPYQFNESMSLAEFSYFVGSACVLLDEIATDVVPKEDRKCNCDSRELFIRGCNCGGK